MKKIFCCLGITVIFILLSIIMGGYIKQALIDSNDLISPFEFSLGESEISDIEKSADNKLFQINDAQSFLSDCNNFLETKQLDGCLRMVHIIYAYEKPKLLAEYNVKANYDRLRSFFLDLSTYGSAFFSSSVNEREIYTSFPYFNDSTGVDNFYNNQYIEYEITNDMIDYYHDLLKKHIKKPSNAGNHIEFLSTEVNLYADYELVQTIYVND